ncbi:MAG: hypothetical protein L0Y60_14630 [Beijerinckiaceae bacterium]|nr:hypothetical protein [Beijerinckiaceae bacterium]
MSLSHDFLESVSQDGPAIGQQATEGILSDRQGGDVHRSAIAVFRQPLTFLRG